MLLYVILFIISVALLSKQILNVVAAADEANLKLT